MIDVGTTAQHLARALPMDLTCTVITCSILVATELASRPGVDLIVASGRVRPGDLAVSGPQTLSYFSGIYPDLAFLGSGGVHTTAGLTDFYPDEVEVRRAVIANAGRSFVLVDSSKFGVIGRYHVASLGQLTGFICEASPSADLRAAIERQGSTLLLP